MIDPKELRIGSHYYNGSYVEPIIGRVLSIDGSVSNLDDIQVGLICDMPLDKDSDPYEAAMAHYLEPIPITAELLMELGFKMTNEIGDERHVAWVREKPWDAYIEYNMNAKLFFAHFGPFNVIRVDYLHEAEFAFYLAYKQELIKE